MRRKATVLAAIFAFLPCIYWLDRSFSGLEKVQQTKVSVANDGEKYFGLNLNPNVKAEGRICPVPEQVLDGQPWPECSKKVTWMTRFWTTDPCYRAAGVNNSVCSILEYLSQKEGSCPPTRFPPKKPNFVLSEKLLQPRSNFSQLMNDLKRFPDFAWIVNRISAMEQLWANSGRDIFSTKLKEKRFQKKKIHLHLGLMELGMGKSAGGAGALGELVQWSDLIASLYILGHDVMVTHTKRQLVYTYTEYAFAVSKSACSEVPGYETFPFDMVYTDIRGYKIMNNMLPKFDSAKCRFRILDSFGTEAHFNVHPTNEGNPFGGLRLNLGQINTMYPHSPDNTFLGFVVESAVTSQSKVSSSGVRDIALVYGKDGSFWKGSAKYIEIIKGYVSEVHATVAGDLSDIPDFVINHGILNNQELHMLLQRTKVFVGLGFPFEGPAPLEAIATGAVFLNPTFAEPINGENHDFFRNKPTNRFLRSQNPYVQEFIRKPYVYNVDVGDERSLHEALKMIGETGNLEPYLPHEFSTKGMLERVGFQIEKQDFCSRHFFSGPLRQVDNIWPPLSSLKAVASKKSCKEACQIEGLICEPLFFPALNTKNAFETSGFHCEVMHYPSVPKTAYPAYFTAENACCIQTHNLYFSCADTMSGFVRLCPCRDFIKEQVALCKGCS